MSDNTKKSTTTIRDKITGEAILPKMTSSGTMKESVQESIKRNRKALDKLKKQ